MASRSRTTFKKRQKELARMEKQRDKAAKRMQRKAEKLAGGVPGADDDMLLDAESSESAESPENTESPEKAESAEPSAF
jgi:hypothetical protein